jgi:hypothetical protein
MKWHDDQHRVVAEINARRIQIGTFLIERTTGSVNGWIIGNDPTLITNQKPQEQCSKCHRWVGTACEVPDDPERCMQRDGAWDFCCDEFYNPWKYNL